jgi:Ca-activated chloride channel homolog
MRRISQRRSVWLALGLLLPWLHTQRAAAELPAFLRSENSQVRDGNQALQKGDAKGALESYNRAAHRLPDAPGVQLDRGIALLKQGDYGKSREALLAATSPSASSDVRADAYQDLALSFYREADGLATQNKHEDAQKLFREALDASKHSLHLRPGDPNTAWNLELAARRIREEQQKQKEEDEKKQQEDKDKQKDKDKDQQKQDGSDQNQDQNQDKQDQQQGDKDQGGQNQDKQHEPKPDEKKDQQNGDQGDKKPKPQDQPDKQTQPAEPDQQKPPEKALPREAEQALDSLEDGEENFERYRARQRANRERRAPEKDW